MLRSVTGKRVLVTGATGFIGLNLVKRLIHHGATVTALDGQHVIYHVAAALADGPGSSSLFQKVNVEGTRLLAT